MRGTANAAVAEQLSSEEQALLEADRSAVSETPETSEPIADEPATQPAETEAAGDDGQPKPQQTVPHAALHEERERRKGVEKQLEEANRRSQLLEDRFSQLLQRMGQPAQQQPAQQQQPQIPTFEENPAEHLRLTQAHIGEVLGQVVQHLAGRTQQDQVAANTTALAQRAVAMEREFAAATPDYNNAAAHLFDARRRELIAAGWTDPAEIQQMMSAEANGLAHRALQQGKNPAEVVYELAKVRGYQPAAAAPAAPTGEERVQTVARGQQQARGVGALHSNGPAGSGGVDARRIANMSDGDFQAFLEKASTEQLHDAFGT